MSWLLFEQRGLLKHRTIRLEKGVEEDNSCEFLYTLDAWARPSNLGICPAVGDISAEEFFMFFNSFQEPSSFKDLLA